METSALEEPRRTRGQRVSWLSDESAQRRQLFRVTDNVLEGFRQARRAKGLLNRELAVAANMDPGRLVEVLAQRKRITLVELAALARILECDLNKLLGVRP